MHKMHNCIKFYSDNTDQLSAQYITYVVYKFSFKELDRFQAQQMIK